MERRTDPRPILPPEAGTYISDAFNPRDEWLEQVSPALQKQAMREWFEARYQDPAMDTPMDDGEYIFVNGGPYHASDLLHSRFGGIVSEELLDELADELSGDSWDWVPKSSEEFDFDFNVNLLIEPETREAPRFLFNQRMEDLEQLLNAGVERSPALLLRHLVFGAYISALEAYLAETMSYWIRVDEEVLKRFVKSHPEFRNQKVTVAEVFDKAASMLTVVEERLNRQVWHRFNDVRVMFQEGLDIKMPPIGELMKAVEVRHDIVHRAGRQKGGLAHAFTNEDILALSKVVKEFVAAIETSLATRYPLEF